MHRPELAPVQDRSIDLDGLLAGWHQYMSEFVIANEEMTKVGRRTNQKQKARKHFLLTFIIYIIYECAYQSWILLTSDSESDFISIPISTDGRTNERHK